MRSFEYTCSVDVESFRTKHSHTRLFPMWLSDWKTERKGERKILCALTCFAFVFRIGSIFFCVCVRQHRRYAVDVRLFRTSSNVKRFFRLFTATAYYGSQIESKMCLHFDLRIVFKIFSRNLLAKLCPNEAEHFGYSHSIWCCDRIHFLFLSWIHSIAWLP